MTIALEYPRMPEARAVAAVAASVVIQACSFLFQAVPILLFLAFWLPHAFYGRAFVLRPSRDMALVLALPVLCFYSLFWSDYMFQTAYSGLEYIVMILAVVVMCRVTSLRAFIRGLSLGVMLVMAATLASGHYSRDYFSGTYSLVGFFGSKNAVGFLAQFGFFTAFCLLFTRMKVWEKMLFAVLPLVVCAACLYLSKAATATVALAFGLGVVFAGWLLSRLDRRARVLALLFSLFAAATAAVVVVALELPVVDALFGSLGKDTTLTGRTYLWSEGIKNGMERPVLGYGYSGFWMPGQPQAEKYWAVFGIGNKGGFHFHSLFVQIFVDGGFVGLAIVAILVLANCLSSLRRVLADGMNLETGFLLGLAWMFLARAPVEVDIAGPFGFGVLLFFSILPRLAGLKPGKVVS